MRLFLNKIKRILTERRLPYSITSRIKSIKHSSFFFYNKLNHLFKKNRKKHPQITFICGFHGETGAVYSIANIANTLAEKYQVHFVSHPVSKFNILLNNKVRIINQTNYNSDLFICDLSCEHELLENLKHLDKIIIMTCHGMLHSTYGLSPEHKIKSISYADKVHFVASVQQDEYKLNEDAFFIIPNMSSPVKKTVITNNAGSVGNLNLKNKNVEQSVAIALKSKADKIHLWSIDEDKWKTSRVVAHKWETDKEKIFNSFDVLVFMSEEEALSMVVIEAMSAGIPCLLSPINAFKPFIQCPGIEMLSQTSSQEPAEILNKLLLNKESLKDKIHLHWEKTYSKNAISLQWYKVISEIIQ